MLIQKAEETGILLNCFCEINIRLLPKADKDIYKHNYKIISLIKIHAKSSTIHQKNYTSLSNEISEMQMIQKMKNNEHIHQIHKREDKTI